MSFQIPGDQFDAEVQTLRERGVTFSTFEAEGLTWVDGVASYDDFKSAWFEDPDGNVLKGIKDPKKIDQFVAAVRAADRQPA